MKASIYLNCKTAGQARLRILKNKFFLKNIRNILHRHAIFLLKAHAILNPLLNRLSRQSKLCWTLVTLNYLVDKGFTFIFLIVLRSKLKSMKSYFSMVNLLSFTLSFLSLKQPNSMLGSFLWSPGNKS